MNTEAWHNVYITDKSGVKRFNTTASPMSTPGAIREMKRHIEMAKKHPAQYHFLDAHTAVVMLDGEPYGEPLAMTDEELLAELIQ